MKNSTSTLTEVNILVLHKISNLDRHIKQLTKKMKFLSLFMLLSLVTFSTSKENFHRNYGPTKLTQFRQPRLERFLEELWMERRDRMEKADDFRNDEKPKTKSQKTPEKQQIDRSDEDDVSDFLEGMLGIF